jgi:hypothetical protein
MRSGLRLVLITEKCRLLLLPESGSRLRFFGRRRISAISLKSEIWRLERYILPLIFEAVYPLQLFDNFKDNRKISADMIMPYMLPSRLGLLVLGKFRQAADLQPWIQHHPLPSRKEHGIDFIW